jgi:hypothetical protein
MFDHTLHLLRLAWTAFIYAPKREREVVIVGVIALAVASTYVHELGHLVVGRGFGMIGRIQPYFRRSDRSTWTGSLLCCDFGETYALATDNQKRVVAASGPLAHVLLAWCCIRYGWLINGPTWVNLSVLGARCSVLGARCSGLELVRLSSLR